MLCVLGDETGPFGRHIRVRKDGLDRTLRLTRAAIDALVRVDVVLILTLVDAVDGTNFYAARVLRVDAGLNDDVRHGSCGCG